MQTSKKIMFNDINIILTQNDYANIVDISIHNQENMSSISELTLLKNFKLDLICTEIQPELDSSKRTIFILSIKQDDKILSTKMLSEGVYSCMLCFAAKNIMTKIDVVMIKYSSETDIEILQQTKLFLQEPSIAAIMHGSMIPLLSKKNIEFNKENYCLITGGSRGIGAATALQIAQQQQQNIILTGRPGNQQAEIFAKSLEEKFGINAEYFPLLQNDIQSCTQLAEHLKKNKISLQTIIHNAGVGTKTSVEQSNGDDISETLIKVNSIGPLILQQELEKQNVIAKNCCVVVVSSVGAIRPFQEMHPIDIASKPMLNSWVDLLSTKENLNVITVYPGATDTDMFQKSTTNSLKEKGLLNDFTSQISKQMIAKPSDIGRIISYCVQNSTYLNKAKIPTCCGLHIEYKNLPNVSKDTLKKLNKQKGHFMCEENTYNKDTNPFGMINFGTSMNRILAQAKIKDYLPSHISSHDTNYSKLEGKEAFRKLVAQNTSYNKDQTMITNIVESALDIIMNHFELISIKGQPFENFEAVIDHSGCSLVEQSQAKCQIVFEKDIEKQLKYIDLPTVFVINSQKELIQTENENVIYVYNHTFQTSILTCGVIHTKSSKFMQHFINQAVFFPLTSTLQSAVVQNIDVESNLDFNIYESIQKMYEQKNLKITAENIQLGGGASCILQGISKALFKKGDIIALDAPYYPGFDNHIGRAGVVLQQNNFLTRCSLLKRVERAQEDGFQGYLICNPVNPTGDVYTKQDVLDLIEFAKKYPQFQLIFDEMYANSIYDESVEFQSAVQFTETLQNVHVVYGFAKDFGLCGFKLGILLSSNKKVIEKFNSWKKIQTPNRYCLQLIDKILKESNYGQDVFRTNKKILQDTFKIVFEELDKYKIPYHKPKSGVYVWLDLRQVIKNDPSQNEFSIWHTLFFKHGLSISGGTEFKAIEQGYFRICPVMDADSIVEGVRRLNMIYK